MTDRSFFMSKITSSKLRQEQELRKILEEQHKSWYLFVHRDLEIVRQYHLRKPDLDE